MEPILSLKEIIAACGVNRMLAMDPADATALYPRVRASLHEHYQGVGPRASRHVAQSAEREDARAALRGERFGSELHAYGAREEIVSQATALETERRGGGRGAAMLAELHATKASYELASHGKSLLAILTGRWDDALTRPGTPYGVTVWDGSYELGAAMQADVERVCQARRIRAGITVDMAAHRASVASVAESAARRRRTQGRTPSRAHATELLAAHGGDMVAAADAGDYDRGHFAERVSQYAARSVVEGLYAFAR